MKLVAFLLATILITNIGPSCLTSSEEFSSEVVIPNYSLQNLDYTWQKTDYGYAQAKDNRLITLISDTKNPTGLSVRVQIPTEIVESNRPLLKLVSNSATGKIRSNVGNNVNGWNIDCKDQTCTIEKNDITLQTEVIGREVETSLEIKHLLSACEDNCRGVCITAAQNPVCIDLETKQDIDMITKYLNLSNNLNELLNNYRVTSEFIQVKDLSPAISETIDWKKEMQSVLLDLKSKGVISTNEKEIDQISNLAKRGQAGERYRIVQDSNGAWTYYYKLPGAKISSEKDCKAYELKVNTSPDQNAYPINAFYLVPIILVSLAAVLLLILVIVSRTIKHKSKHRQKI